MSQVITTISVILLITCIHLVSSDLPAIIMQCNPGRAESMTTWLYFRLRRSELTQCWVTYITLALDLVIPTIQTISDPVRTSTTFCGTSTQLAASNVDTRKPSRKGSAFTRTSRVYWLVVGSTDSNSRLVSFHYRYDPRINLHGAVLHHTNFSTDDPTLTSAFDVQNS